MKQIFTLVSIFITLSLSSQTERRYLAYVFPADSLNGFDETTLKQEALSRGFFGSEYKVFMYRAKREFINKKYGYYSSLNAPQKASPSRANSAPCVNEDFEASTVGTVTAVSGWSLSQGQNMGSCAMAGCCTTSVTMGNVFIRSTPYVQTGTTTFTVPNSPLGGSKVIQLNNEVINAGEVVRLRQTFPVTSTNVLFQYAYLAALNGAGHACCDQPYVNVNFFDCLNNLIACGSTSISAPGPSCPSSTVGWVTNSSGVSYNSSWQVAAIDLTSYLGSCVTIEVTVGDCDGWAHEGYCFFDAKCSSLNITANSISTPPFSTINACGPTVNMTAPAGFNPYAWSGPVTSTAQSINTSASGTYSLTMGSGFCASTKVFTLNVIAPPSLSLTASSSTACTSGNTIALSGSPSGGVYSGTGVTGTVFTPPAAPGNYPVTYMYTSPTTSCTNTKTISIAVSVCLGIESTVNGTTSVKIYPNPNNGDFKIEGNTEDVVTISNELGQVLRTIKLNSANNYSTVVSNLPGGVYFATGKNFKEKIIVTK